MCNNTVTPENATNPIACNRREICRDNKNKLPVRKENNQNIPLSGGAAGSS